MSRSLAAIFALLLVAAADGPPPATPLPHAAGAPAGPGPGCGGSFTAARGDTLYSIARRCETTVTELVQENRLGQPPRLAAGQQLDIPGFARGRDSLVPPDVDAPRRPPPPMRARPDREPPPPRRAERDIYYFQAGDTLYSLARWARTSLPALLAANPGLDPRDIDAGTTILLPPGAVRPEPMRLRERGRPLPIDREVAAPRQPDLMPPPRVRPAPPPPPMARPAPPRDDEDADEADMAKPDDADDEDEDDRPTPGGMDDGEPEPDGMF